MSPKKGMSAGTKKDLISFLEENEVKNINMLNFIKDNPVRSLERIGNSVLMRGESDCLWVYISGSDERDLEGVLRRLTPEDRTFAAIEDWMLPALTAGRKIEWHLSMVRLFLPEGVDLSGKRFPHIVPLSPDDADYIYEHSVYRKVTRAEYIRSRILAGPSAAVYESEKPVAWLMTQDDGSIGVLHVVEDYRGKSYAYDMTICIALEIRRKGGLPFVHIEEANTKAMNLARKVGFRRDRTLHWFKIRPEGVPEGSEDYC
jgi:8-oxo-dGTP diphosphatase